MAVTKILRQNHIINKIENLLMITERLEERMDKLETYNIDQTLWKYVILLYYICYLIIIIMYI